MKKFVVAGVAFSAAAALLASELTAREFATDAAEARQAALLQGLVEAAENDPGDRVIIKRLAFALRDAGFEEDAALWLEHAASLPTPEPTFSADDCIDCTQRGLLGPDLLVADLQDVKRHGQSSDITAFTIGTTACNMGDMPALWEGATVNHPVIGANAFRYLDGRFEQVGMSWLKHGFSAFNEDFCSACFNPDPESTGLLHPGCSDPYSASLNAIASLLGPRSEVNPTDGTFPLDHDIPAGNSTLRGRIQIANADLHPPDNTGAQYFVEGFYISSDDSAAGNNLNNCSYREVAVVWNGTNTTYSFTFPGGTSTVTGLAAIYAWQAIDPAVEIATVDIPGDGRLYVGCRVTDNMDGTWDYEYAVYNMNSNRAARGFVIPIPGDATVTNVGFTDVDYHSGEIYDGTDWSDNRLAGAMRWTTNDHATDPTANALRYGTLYNYRFTADAPPMPVTGSLLPFLPGGEMHIDFTTQGPTPSTICKSWDFDDNGFIDALDLAQVLSFWQEPYEAVGIASVLSFWGLCPEPAQ